MMNADDIASLDVTLHTVRNVAFGGIIFFCLVGLDLILGGRTMAMLGKVFNKRFDLDSLVINGLSGFRQGTEKKMMNIDEAMLKARARVFIGALLLIPAVLLVILVVARR